MFCFNCFCAYLLMSGWRAVHEAEKPDIIDWMIPASLFCVAFSVSFYALFHDGGMRTFYMMFFALNAFYLSWRDWQHLKRRAYWNKHQLLSSPARLVSGRPTPPPGSDGMSPAWSAA